MKASHGAIGDRSSDAEVASTACISPQLKITSVASPTSWKKKWFGAAVFFTDCGSRQ
jgi:hypothetical protein